MDACSYRYATAMSMINQYKGCTVHEYDIMLDHPATYLGMAFCKVSPDEAIYEDAKFYQDEDFDDSDDMHFIKYRIAMYAEVWSITFPWTCIPNKHNRDIWAKWFNK